ncbi:hypothetical protein TWF694_002901 [Orbilia ellipsospora]|uniref:Uncharacterized protein n=1 Tax=Orbilia ellipsospora TaxID=2528407 RepID=A0AAV9X057_9PEZI
MDENEENLPLGARSVNESHQDKNISAPSPKHSDPPNILDIRFEWESKQGPKSDSVNQKDVTKNPPVIVNPKRWSTPVRVESLRKQEEEDGRPGTAPDYLYPGQPPVFARRRIFPGGTFSQLSSQRANDISASTLTTLLPTSLPSLLSLSRNKQAAITSPVLYNVIKKSKSFITEPPKLEAKMTKQNAFIYLDKTAVLSILATVDYVHPVMAELYLHTQLSLVPGATRSCEELTVSDFIDGFTNPSLDPILTNKLENYWWSIECSLPNGVIIIHSLARSTYSHVYIFRFTPVTGVFTKLVPQEVSDMRAYLEANPNDSKFFPKVATPPRLTIDKQSLRFQLGGGFGLASRSMTNLANLLPASVTRKISGSSFQSHTHHFQSSLADSLLGRLKNDLLPNLLKWSGNPIRSVNISALMSGSRQIDENNPPLTLNSKRSSFLRSASSTYLKHPLQMLRQSYGSSTSIISQNPPSSTAEPPIITPAIVLTTPERQTRILKLRDSIPKPPTQSRTDQIVETVKSTISFKRPEPPTFVFWKDVFEQISFQTDINRVTGRLTFELETNINQQISDDLNQLLKAVTDMFAKEADGMQLDFIRIKVPDISKKSRSFEARKLHGIRPLLDDKPRESFSTTPEKDDENAKEQSRSDTVDDQDFVSEAGSRESLALTDGDEPTEENIRLQGQLLATGLKLDQQLKLGFETEELEFSSILMSPDTYVVEAVLAGWFAETDEWIKENDLHWRDFLFDKQAGKRT